MTKQEQIEEMVSIMAASNNPFVDVPIEIMHNAAEALYNAGCRKIDDDCAVITKAELKQYKVQAVKEFAEKLWNKIKDNGIYYKIGLRALGEEIDELLKEREEWKTISNN